MHPLEVLALDEWGYDDSVVRGAFRQFLQQRRCSEAALPADEATAGAFLDVLRAVAPVEHVDFDDEIAGSEGAVPHCALCPGAGLAMHLYVVRSGIVTHG